MPSEDDAQQQRKAQPDEESITHEEPNVASRDKEFGAYASTCGLAALAIAAIASVPFLAQVALVFIGSSLLVLGGYLGFRRYFHSAGTVTVGLVLVAFIICCSWAAWVNWGQSKNRPQTASSAIELQGVRQSPGADKITSSPSSSSIRSSPAATANQQNEAQQERRAMKTSPQPAKHDSARTTTTTGTANEPHTSRSLHAKPSDAATETAPSAISKSAGNLKERVLDLANQMIATLWERDYAVSAPFDPTRVSPPVAKIPYPSRSEAKAWVAAVNTYFEWRNRDKFLEIYAELRELHLRDETLDQLYRHYKQSPPRAMLLPMDMEAAAQHLRQLAARIQ